MTSPISAIGLGLPTTGVAGVAGTSGVPGTAATSTAGTAGASGPSFADVLTSQIDQLNGVQANADSLAQAAATGDLQDAHDYMIASAEARLATDTVVTLKNSAVAAFTEIMRMPV